MEKDIKIKELEAKIAEFQSEIGKLKNEPKFEVGKWYINPKGQLINYQKGENVYGFGFYGKWETCKSWSFDIESLIKYEFRPAETLEIQNILIKEAKKRIEHESRFKAIRNVKQNEDYGIGTAPVSYDMYGRMGCSFSYNKNTDTLYTYGFGLYIVYEKGQWATIIKEDKIEIGGHEVKRKNSGNYVVGCKNIKYNLIHSLYESINDNDFEVKINGFLVTKELLQKMLNMKY